MESCVIQLTPAAHKYGNLNIRPCGKEFFPPDVFGAPSKKAGLGVPVTLQVDGLPNPVETDIPTDKKTGNQRWIFRERKWVKDFVHYHKLWSGDFITINRLDKKTYEIVPGNKHVQLLATQEKWTLRTQERNPTHTKLFTAPTMACKVTQDTPLECLNLNWSERDLPERERTKHVHRLHPYLGKYIPQLVKYFIDDHADDFKGKFTVL